MVIAVNARRPNGYMNPEAGTDSFLTPGEIDSLGLADYGSNARISRFARFYRPELVSLGDHVRIDDFSVITGSIKLGSYCHIAAHSIFSGGTDSSIIVGDFCTFAYGVRVFSKSDDYLGDYMTGSVVPCEFTNATSSNVHISSHTIVGTSATLLPGISLGEGTSIGAMSLVKTSTDPWGVYAGIPARFLKKRGRRPLLYAQRIER